MTVVVVVDTVVVVELTLVVVVVVAVVVDDVVYTHVPQRTGQSELIKAHMALSVVEQ